jgi:DNA helicase-2/ATP-dependent DNA helicase PcrA
MQQSLVEEVAAQVAESGALGATQVRREVRRLVQIITKAARSDLGFAGDVVATRLVRMAQQLGDSDAAAIGFLVTFAHVVGAEFTAAGFLSPGESKVIEGSGQAMVDDIRNHEALHHMRTTTVRDLGLFARGSNSMRLMTMHGSKGREFDAVALIDVFDGHVPFYKAKPGDQIEAEGRRLLYVALTRAKKVLMMFTLADVTDRTQPSRFLSRLFPMGAQKP